MVIIVKAVAYGILFWVWYEVCIQIGSAIYSSTASFANDIVVG